jgi:hypothetical protein
MVQNTPQYNRHTHSETAHLTAQINRMILNTPHYKDILQILKPRSIPFDLKPLSLHQEHISNSETPLFTARIHRMI